MKNFKHNDLLFLPLGGSNEIGMNVNLYHYKGKWLIIDLGAGFADDYYPGVQMLAPDLEFIIERKDDLLGIVLTHGHEDHVGSVGYLWDTLRCPIYATPFTAAIARNKLAQEGLDKVAKITEVQTGSSFDIGEFSLEMIQLTHSIPEMNAIILRTEHGNILHSGDWKFDPDPVVGVTSDEKALKKLGDEGVLALVCDSTNVFTEKHSGSEGDLQESISELIKGREGLVCVTTFASNVARMETIAKAAAENGRRVVLVGFSLHRISTIARENGYMKDVEPFLSDKEIKNHPRDKILVMCTGCQGEPNAAMTKIASGSHPTIRLSSKDTVIFSSKIIPGNEKKIFRLFNIFVKLGCTVLTEKDHFVHVSGHPSRCELEKMYKLVRPEIAIPVHGEPVHLNEHVKIAKGIGVPKTIEIQNGEVVRLSSEPKSLAHVQSGYLAVDGRFLQPKDGSVMQMRRRLQRDGLVMVSIVVNHGGGLAVEPKITFPGVLDPESSRDFRKILEEELIAVIDAQSISSDDKLYTIIRKTVRRLVSAESGKKPSIEIHLLRV